eukprot:1477596-Pleurochrysis_carterae.AAC.1
MAASEAASTRRPLFRRPPSDRGRTEQIEVTRFKVPRSASSVRATRAADLAVSMLYVVIVYESSYMDLDGSSTVETTGQKATEPQFALASHLDPSPNL